MSEPREPMSDERRAEWNQRIVHEASDDHLGSADWIVTMYDEMSAEIDEALVVPAAETNGGTAGLKNRLDVP